MNLDDADVIDRDACLVHGALARKRRHLVSHEVDGRAAEEIGRVCCELLAGDQHGLAFQMRSLVEELLRHDDYGRAAIRGRAALEFGQRCVDHGRLHDLFQGVLVLEL